jgi:hypothetical protein
LARRLPEKNIKEQRMNLLLQFSVLMFCFAYIGCTTHCDFDVKEKCSKYVEGAKKQKGENNYFGTFFSRKNNTCISIYWGDNTFFKDELTGRVIETTVGIPDYQKAGKTLDLVGWDPSPFVPQF